MLELQYEFKQAEIYHIVHFDQLWIQYFSSSVQIKLLGLLYRGPIHVDYLDSLVKWNL